MASSISADPSEVAGAQPNQQRSAPPPRVTLQRVSHGTMRRHLRRSITRLGVLLACDSVAYVLARAAIRSVRDYDLIGHGVAAATNRFVPLGFLGGWEYAVALLVGLALIGNYGRGDKWRDPGRVFAGVALGTGLALWHPLWVLGIGHVGIQFAVTTLGVWGVLSLDRGALHAILIRTRGMHPAAERAIFVGDPFAQHAANVQSRLVKGGAMTSLGWVTTGSREGEGILGMAREIWEVLNRTLPDTVVLCGQLPDDLFEAVVSASMAGGCQVLSVPRYEGLAPVRAGVIREQGVRMVELSVPSLRAQQLLIKRCIDLAGSLAGLLLLSPVFVIAALVIRLDSPGPVLFTQERVGFGGKVFRMLKFRTMRDGADDEKATLGHLNRSTDPRLFKIPEDPRVTRAGQWLRRWSIDELPQLINVLFGDMSLVGPRPFFEADLATYLEHHFARLGAKPGITGLWQVRGRSDVVDFEEVVRLDCEYIERWSLLLDARILASTLPAVVRKTGAY